MTAMRFDPLRLDGSFTLHALTVGKKRGEKRPWKIPPGFLASLLRNNRRRYLIRDKSGNVRAACHRPSSLLSSLPRFHVRLAVAARVVGSPLPLLPSFLRPFFPPRRKMQRFSDCVRFAGGVERSAPSKPKPPLSGTFCHSEFSRKCRRVTNA